jgi:hypothetical protein
MHLDTIEPVLEKVESQTVGSPENLPKNVKLDIYIEIVYKEV